MTTVTEFLAFFSLYHSCFSLCFHDHFIICIICFLSVRKEISRISNGTAEIRTQIPSVL